MQESVIIAVAIIIVISAGVYLLVRSGRQLRRFSNQLDRDWLDIEVLIKQMSDNLPRLIQTCRSYMPQNQASLQLAAAARKAQQNAASARERSEAASKASKAVRALLSEANLIEGLKSNSTYIQIQNQLVETEERIEDRREAFNDDVSRFNSRLGRFPGSLSAGKLKPHAAWLPNASHPSPSAGLFPVPDQSGRQPARVKR
ncbi:MAG: LemA family protein [Acidobacteriota bacterium]|nr:LemA family protein [Acidobacteriota bacterium]